MSPFERRQLPNLVTGTRLALMPVLLVLAAAGEATAALAVIALCFFTDLLDGFLARRYRVTSALGARLDSWADFLLYLSLPVAGWWLWPEIVRRELAFFGAALAAITLPPLVALAKFRAPPSYHTWAAKASAAAIGVSVLVLFGLDLAWPFRLAVALTVLAAGEELAITLVLDAPRHDVPSLWHVLRR